MNVAQLLTERTTVKFFKFFHGWPSVSSELASESAHFKSELHARRCHRSGVHKEIDQFHSPQTPSCPRAHKSTNPRVHESMSLLVHKSFWSTSLFSQLVHEF